MITYYHDAAGYLVALTDLAALWSRWSVPTTTRDVYLTHFRALAFVPALLEPR